MNINLQPNITGANISLVKGTTQADLTNAVNNSRTYRDESEAFSIVSENKSIVATDSANSAYSSATTASNAANTAITKANEANSSAISASASETVCIAKATIATDKADIAIAQSTIATNKASEANTSANTANIQANIAITKASEASISASNALTSENNADTSEANALIYRNQAESFANSINHSNLVHISGTETITGNKTFSGTVSGLTKATVGLGNVTNESKATMFTSPTFTGTVTLPSTTSIGNVSSTELGYIDGVTSSIQTQLDSKVAKVTSTDNAIVRFDGITGAVQNSSVIINDSGNLLLTSGTGGLGYGTGAGGTVTQLTSKNTNVTLNKPSGRVIMNNSTFPANGTVSFTVYNTAVNYGDTVSWSIVGGITLISNYEISIFTREDSMDISITNKGSTSLSEPVEIMYSIIRGATA